MSGHIGQALGQAILGTDDLRIAWEPGPILVARREIVRRPGTLGTTSNVGDFRSPWWPARSAHVGYDSASRLDLAATRWDEAPLPEGAMARYAFVGVARDEYGSPSAGCLIRCYVTSTNELTEITTSLADGTYQATTPYAATAHFVTMHCLAPVERAGCTLDTVTPA